MNTKIFYMALATMCFSQTVWAEDVNYKYNAEMVAKELNVECQHVDIAKDACVIAFFKNTKDGWDQTTTLSDFYRVLNGKTKAGYFFATDYYSNGQQQALPIQTKNGVLLLSKTGSFDFADPKKVWKEWSKDGELITEAAVKKGLPHGKTKQWDIGEYYKIRHEGHYSDTGRIGTWTSWDELTGKKMWQTTYKPNETEDSIGWWSDSGKIRYKGRYVKNLEQGKWLIWYSNGKKAAEGSCVQGVPQHDWQYWSFAGEYLKSREEWLQEGSQALLGGLFVFACDRKNQT